MNPESASLVEGYAAHRKTNESLNVSVRRFDEYASEKKLSRVSLIKIDTEGFEQEVLQGACGYFDEHKDELPAVIAEISPHAFALLSRDIGELEEFMSKYGYKAYAICGRHRIDIRKITRQTNVFFQT